MKIYPLQKRQLIASTCSIYSRELLIYFTVPGNAVFEKWAVCAIAVYSMYSAMAETLPSSLRTPDCYVQTLQPPICVFIKLEVINGITSAILKGSQLEDIKSSFCVGFIENIRERRLFNGSGCHVWSHNAINFCDSRACCPAFPLACAEGISSHQIMALPGWL